MPKNKMRKKKKITIPLLITNFYQTKNTVEKEFKDMSKTYLLSYFYKFNSTIRGKSLSLVTISPSHLHHCKQIKGTLNKNNQKQNSFRKIKAKFRCFGASNNFLAFCLKLEFPILCHLIPEVRSGN